MDRYFDTGKKRFADIPAGATPLEARLMRKMGANTAAEVLGAEKAGDVARRSGALDFIGQLDRMTEADRVLQLAWEAKVFHEAVWEERTVPIRLPDKDIDRVIKVMHQTALDLLAEQYGDLHVKVRLEPWNDINHMKRCPARTFGGSEAVVAGKRR